MKFATQISLYSQMILKFIKQLNVHLMLICFKKI